MGKSTLIRIVVAMKQAISREGLSNLLNRQPDFDVVSTASDEEQAKKLARKLKPDVILLDLALCTKLSRAPDMIFQSDGTTGIRTIVLAAASEKDNFSQMLHVGAQGVVIRELGSRVLVKAIRSVAKGMYWIGGREVQDLATALKALEEPGARISPAKTFGLTTREMEVIGAIVIGISNREIAIRLKISEATVKHHVTNIFDKMGVYNRLELALFAMHHGFVRNEQQNIKKTKREIVLDQP